MYRPRYYDPRDPECPYDEDYTYDDACEAYERACEERYERKHEEE